MAEAGSHGDPHEVGAPDPHSGEHEAHDVLAADEFAMPTRADRPPDPHAGDREPHDVLAADEFAMPGRAASHYSASSPAGARLALPLALAVLALVLLLRRRS